jgi:hypothetical protein
VWKLGIKPIISESFLGKVDLNLQTITKDLPDQWFQLHDSSSFVSKDSPFVVRGSILLRLGPVFLVVDILPFSFLFCFFISFFFLLISKINFCLRKTGLRNPVLEGHPSVAFRAASAKRREHYTKTLEHNSNINDNNNINSNNNNNINNSDNNCNTNSNSSYDDQNNNNTVSQYSSPNTTEINNYYLNNSAYSDDGYKITRSSSPNPTPITSTTPTDEAFNNYLAGQHNAEYHFISAFSINYPFCHFFLDIL